MAEKLLLQQKGKTMSRGILTIDDIASVNTPAIVDYLTEKGIPTLMFAWGNQVEQHYDEAVYALFLDHLLENGFVFEEPEFL